MGKLHQVVLALATIGCLTAAPLAHAIPFEITTVSFDLGTGFGEDPEEETGTLLDVQFTTSGFAGVFFDLASAGDVKTFNFAKVNLRERDGQTGGILVAETDDLSVKAKLIFSDPFGETLSVSTIGIATAGRVSDQDVDFSLVWNPVTVYFGSGGEFDLKLGDLSFTQGNVQDESATITLRSLPTIATAPQAPAVGASVPEPAVLSLLGLGFLGMGLARLRKVA